MFKVVDALFVALEKSHEISMLLKLEFVASTVLDDKLKSFLAILV